MTSRIASFSRGILAVLGVLLPLMSSAASDGQAKPRVAEALTLISTFAENFCSKVPASGKTQDIDITASANAELVGLVKKLAELGVRGAAKYKNTVYQGLLQKDLAEALKDRDACKLRIWNDLKDRLLPAVKTQALTSGASPRQSAALLLRTARLLTSTNKNVSVLEIVLENPTTKPVALNSVTLEAETDWGKRCNKPDRNPPGWQKLVLNWNAITAHLPEEESASWTEIADTPVRVETSFKPASCSDYSHRLSIRIPVQDVVPETGLSRVTFQITEEVPSDRFAKGLASWQHILATVQAPVPVMPEQLTVSSK